MHGQSRTVLSGFISAVRQDSECKKGLNITQIFLDYFTQIILFYITDLKTTNIVMVHGATVLKTMKQYIVIYYLSLTIHIFVILTELSSAEKQKSYISFGN